MEKATLQSPSGCSVTLLYCTKSSNLACDVIEDAVQFCSHRMGSVADFSFEVVVVLDSSSAGGLSARSRSIFARREVRVVPAPHGGSEEAICAGALHAKGSWIVCAPADGTLRPSELMKLMTPAQVTPDSCFLFSCVGRCPAPEHVDAHAPSHGVATCASPALIRDAPIRHSRQRGSWLACERR